MKTALFTNFSNEEFIGSWDGKQRKFPPGSSLYMPDWLAKHYALGLVNRELIRRVKNEKGELVPVYEKGETMTSPKFPNQVPLFMELFNKAVHEESSETDPEPKKDSVDVAIEALNKNRQAKVASSIPGGQDPNEPQIILPPEDDGDDESAFSK